MELKTQKEISQFLEALDPLDYEVLRACVIAHIYGSLDAKDIVDDIMYEVRWEIFEQLTDTELIYEDDHVDEFIDKCFSIYAKEKPFLDRINL